MNSNSSNRSLLRALINFIIKPDLKPIDASFPEKIWWVVKLISAQVFLATVAGLMVNLILKSLNYQGTHAVEEALLTEQAWIFLLQASLLAPLMEETAFRLWLKFSPLRLAVSSFFLGFYLYQIALFSLIEIFQSTIFNFWTFYGIVILVTTISSVAIYFLSNQSENQVLFKKVFAENIRPFYYLTSILFALLHAGNFSNLSSIWFLIPLMVLPQLIFGLGLGFTRIKLGFKWSVFSHALINTMITIPYFISTLGSSNLQKVIKQAEELSPRDLESLSSFDTSLLILTELSFYVILSFELYCLILLIFEFFKNPKAVQ